MGYDEPLHGSFETQHARIGSLDKTCPTRLKLTCLKTLTLRQEQS